MPTQYKIVIVEDNFLLALDLRTMCEDLEHEVLDVARSATDAARKFVELTPDVLITDMQLGPDGDGVDVVETLRDHCPGVRVIFATAASRLDILERISSASPDYVLSKPVSQHGLGDALAVA